MTTDESQQFSSNLAREIEHFQSDKRDAFYFLSFVQIKVFRSYLIQSSGKQLLENISKEKA